MTQWHQHSLAKMPMPVVILTHNQFPFLIHLHLRLLSVPERVYDINQADDDSKKANLEKLSINEEDAWWNQVPLNNLDLSSNSLSHISPKIENLLTLTVLQLHDNALVALPPEIGKLEKLVRLNLSHNKLSQLPSELFSLPDLRHLNISHNEFVELNPDVSNLHMLEFLVSIPLKETGRGHLNNQY